MKSRKHKEPESAPLLDRAAVFDNPTPRDRNGYLFLKCPACGNVVTGNFYQICEIPKETARGDFSGDSSTLDLACPCGMHFHGYTRVTAP